MTENPPGLSAISRRVGRHGEFLAAMQAGLGRELAPGVAPLRGLAGRDPRDFTIALLDAWAAACDVLTFYQERIGTESYRRTATERRSLYELARLVGYQPSPGVAAGVTLAFTLDDFPQAPPVHTTLPVGLAVMSVPQGAETAETFETVEAVPARSPWNALPLLTRQRRPLTGASDRFTVAADSRVTAGDAVLIVEPSGSATLRRVTSTRPDTDGLGLVVELTTAAPEDPWFAPVSRPTGSLGLLAGADLDDAITAVVLANTWKVEDLAAACRLNGWSEQALQDALAAAVRSADSAVTAEVFALRLTASVFGHNAPRYDALPASLRYTTQARVKQDSSYTDADITPAYPASWEGRTLEADAQPSTAGRSVFLDAAYPGIAAGSWVVLSSPPSGAGPGVDVALRVRQNVPTNRTDFATTGRTSRLLLDAPTAFPAELLVRTASVHAQSERLAVVPGWVGGTLTGSRLDLAGVDLALRPGRVVVVTGERSDLPGNAGSEVRQVSEVLIVAGRTVLHLDVPLTHRYVRSSVRVNVNCARATHGQARTEVLGSGDASVPFQRFPLRQPPVTFVSSPETTGSSSTLEVRVNGVRWSQVPFLHGHRPNERIYSTWTTDAGETVVQFGDGRTGARLPSGQDNVTASYRRGVGLAGLVAAGRLSSPLSRPAGLSAVTNPLPSVGAANPESAEEVRANLPLGVLTLGRVVSLRDYEDFARAFAGVAKALAVRTWVAGRRGVAVTVVGPRGAGVEPAGNVHRNLLAALRGSGDPDVPVSLLPARGVLFRMVARLAVGPDHEADAVRSAVRSALLAAFGFDARALAQHVALSEVVGVIRQVPGVVAVDVDELHLAGEAPTRHPEPVLLAAAPAGNVGAELLTVDPDGIAVR